MPVLTDVSGVTDSSGTVVSTKGALFYTTFKSSVNQFIIANATEFLPQLFSLTATNSGLVISIVMASLDHVVKDRNVRKK